MCVSSDLCLILQLLYTVCVVLFCLHLCRYLFVLSHSNMIILCDALVVGDLSFSDD